MYNKTVYLVAALSFLGMAENTRAFNDGANLCVRCACKIRIEAMHEGQLGLGTMTLTYYNVKRPGIQDSIACNTWCNSDDAANAIKKEAHVRRMVEIVSSEVLGRFPAGVGENCPD